MKIFSVQSSTIKAIGYEFEEFKLFVQFNNGKVYEYTQVEAHWPAAILFAESHGKAFATFKRSFEDQPGNYRLLSADEAAELGFNKQPQAEEDLAHCRDLLWIALPHLPRSIRDREDVAVEDMEAWEHTYLDIEDQAYKSGNRRYDESELPK